MNKPLCILMARGGSNRVPRKNVRLFCGLPMIAWATRAACTSEIFTSVIISTDDSEIANVAIQFGATQPFQRPKNLADEFTDTASVLKHALETLYKDGQNLPAYCCCAYGTSAMLTPTLLAEGHTKLVATASECVMAVVEYAHPIERAVQFDTQGELFYRQAEFAPIRTQDITPSYHDIGLFYWFSVAAFLKYGGKSFVPLKKNAIIVPRTAAMDIDTEEDWAIAELLAAQYLKNNNCA